MNSRRIFLSVLLGAMGLIAVAGCSKNKVANPKANERPVLELTRAPFNESTRFEYSYRMNWLGYDPDGRVAYYLYTIDPPTPTPQKPEPETTWVQTDKSERLINFSATQLDSSRTNINGASDFHTFVVKAIDNGGLGGVLQSAPIVRSFYTYTVAPTVQILNPAPTDRGRQYVTPAVRINWTGSDDDGILDNKKPVKYKYILLTGNTPISFQTALNFPDSVRKYYAPRNWAGWDSTTADTTEKLFTNLGVQQDYMFCVISFDEAGAYSPVFSQNSNMLNMRVTFAAQGGPLITIFNDFFFFHYNQGIYSTDERFKIKVEVPAGEEVPFRWFATIPEGSGASLRGFRWALDIDNLDDPTQRTNELTDWKHWSQESGDITSARVGPFAGGEIHHFYLEAVDNNNLKSLAVVKFNVVQSDLGDELLIVNDTRCKVDKRDPGATCETSSPQNLGPWPSAAELDTFLFAQGGYPWKCYPNGAVSKPGLFSRYRSTVDRPGRPAGSLLYDTLGTRTGVSEVRVSLAKLGHYKHVIWMVDQAGANDANNSGTSVSNSTTALTYMSRPGRANSISAYLRQGGQVWLVGGGVGYAATFPYNSRKNDSGTYGPGFTSNQQELNATDPLELTDGRFMYDTAHWQSQFRSTSAVANIQLFHGRFDSAPNTVPPQYQGLPSALRYHSASLGDVLPPQRTNSDYFRGTPNVDIEYLSVENRIVEDTDPDPLGVHEESTLDTLYYATGNNLIPSRAGGNPNPQNAYNVCMTVYHGPAYDYPIIFSGVGFWLFTQNDCQGLVDAVMQGMWRYTKSAPPPPAAILSSSRSVATAASTTIRNVSAVPVLRVGRTPDR